ncbi:hypothetical protein B0H16DRAFT_1534558 [Mycena metata]|uniref:DUF6534 domain-containing protein n=1 Tax=Mycena metata TaxID=1033252 RepID=A0AAD7J7Y4_9AGAR|nr:hypothetical protein B0H16DRAFT_1534558 [Mycena metata]
MRTWRTRGAKYVCAPVNLKRRNRSRSGPTPTFPTPTFLSMAPLNLVPTLGVTLIGIFICCTLYGVTTLQTFIYIKKFWQTDKKEVKLLETAHAAFVCSYIFRVTIIDLDSPLALIRTSVSDDITTGITAFIIFFVHCFYIWRIWILSDKRLLLVIPLAVGAVSHLGLEMAVMALTFRWPDFSQFHRITGYFTGAVAIAAAIDITIAVVMFLLLRTRKTGIKSTEQILNRIVTYTISTGLLTSVIDIVILAAFIGSPDTLVYLCFYDFVPNLYANSLLAMLNSRGDEKLQVGIELDIGGTGSTIQFSNFRSRATTHPGNNTGTVSNTFTDADLSQTKFASATEM